MAIEMVVALHREHLELPQSQTRHPQSLNEPVWRKPTQMYVFLTFKEIQKKTHKTQLGRVFFLSLF